ncbi:putative metallo-peptidase, clan MH, family M18 [Trypanosoma cruzi]|uniref:Putative metallo-peptidase, clan MH, family M18 n=1 Tax=Trypanosoma cruzi TaxID=5693 RepID=A0A2V2UYA4_TRYCR|nr:putative metallo-peptidase, clan MH, family M18 [Trypanosoma cruzi]
MTVVIAHKGTSHFWVRVRGKAAHSSFALTGESCNAIDYATKLITKLREIAEEYRRNGTRHDFQVPFSTLSTNLISGGNALEHRARGVRVPLRVSSASQRDCLQDDAAGAVLRGDAASPGHEGEFEDAEIVITPRMKRRRLRAVRRRPSPSCMRHYNITRFGKYLAARSGPLQQDCRRTNCDMRTPWRGHTLCE